MTAWIIGVIIMLVKLGIILVVLLLVAAYLVYFERKLLGRLQIRLGPNRCGPFGLLQPIADAVKLLLKEDIVPAQADRVIFLLAPAVVAGSAFLIFAVVPFGDTWTIGGQKIPLLVADINVGLLYTLALSSIGVYGVALGGWASNSKYSPAGGDTRGGPDDQLRAFPGTLPGSRGHAGRLLQPGGHCRGSKKLPLYPGPAVSFHHIFYQLPGRNQADSL